MRDRNEIILVLGGGRSGKSNFAQTLAASFGENVVYLATAEVVDEEMESRVARHRQARPPDWQTIEESKNLPHALGQIPRGTDAILLDCLSFWVSNLLLEEGIEDFSNPVVSREKEGQVLNATEKLLKVAASLNIPLIIVSNEVGWGLVPEYPLGRLFRDLAGLVNQRVAKEASTVYLVAAGCSLLIKGKAITSCTREGSKMT